MSDAFFLPDGEHYLSTPLTRGPWDARFQHGGPPSALLTQTLQQQVDDDLALARVTLDFLRPVPIDRLHIRVDPLRGGRTVQRISARLCHRDEAILEATALFVRRHALQPPRHDDPPWPDPESLDPFVFPFFRWEEGYAQAVDVRIVDPPWGATPIRCWGRSRVDLIAGHPTTPEAQVLVLADAESGMGPPVDPLAFTYVNPDLTVYFGRPPASDWIGFDIRSFAGPQGCGLSESGLRDSRGVFGRSAQSLVVRSRRAEVRDVDRDS